VTEVVCFPNVYNHTLPQYLKLTDASVVQTSQVRASAMLVLNVWN